MSSFWRESKFKDLKIRWYKALEEDGFEDIETLDEELKQPCKNGYQRFSGKSKDLREIKLEYYLRLGHALQEQGCDHDIDTLIMQRTSEGFSVKEICEELKTIKSSRNRNTIRWIRRKYENRWGIRKWKPEQMRSARMPSKRATR